MTAVQEPTKAVPLPRGHRTRFHAIVKEDGNFWVNPDTRVGPVVHTRYWIAPFAVAEELLDWWNLLPAEPGQYEATQRVRLAGDMLPPVDRLLPAPDQGEVATPRQLGNAAIRAFRNGRAHVVLDPGEVTVRADYLDVICPYWEHGEGITLRVVDAMKPVSIWQEGAFRGLIMPVRIR